MHWYAEIEVDWANSLSYGVREDVFQGCTHLQNPTGEAGRGNREELGEKVGEGTASTSSGNALIEAVQDMCVLLRHCR